MTHWTDWSFKVKFRFTLGNSELRFIGYNGSILINFEVDQLPIFNCISRTTLASQLNLSNSFGQFKRL